MPKGLFGSKRFTNLGPLVSKTHNDIPVPQFKTKSFGWKKVDFWFKSSGGSLQTTGEVTSPGGRGVERGSSFSLDGAYNDRVGFGPDSHSDFITFIYPLDRENDIPFFYLNPLGKKSVNVGGKNIVIESPSYFSEAEVAVRNEFETSEAEAVVITVDEQDVNDRRETKKEDIRNNEDAEKYGWKDEALDRVDRDADSAVEKIQEIKNNYKVIDEVPRTDFRDMVQKLSTDIRDFDYKDDWDEIEKKLRPIHRTIAESYGVDYSAVKQKARNNF